MANGTPIVLSHRQRCTILAALRMYQLEGILGSVGEFVDIASDGGLTVPLMENEIDELCELINLGE